MTNDRKHGCGAGGENRGGLGLRWLHSGWRRAESYAVVLASSVNNRSLDVLGLRPSCEILGEAALSAVMVRWE